MNERKNLQDIVNLLADKRHVSKGACEEYIRIFVSSVIDALSIDKVVKIKGLGTFKLVVVSERKSVNVQSGKDIIIPSHTKLSFIPDKNLKEEINKPYAHLQTYVINKNAEVDPPEPDDDDEELDEGLVDASAGDESAGRPSPSIDNGDEISELPVDKVSTDDVSLGGGKNVDMLRTGPSEGHADGRSSENLATGTQTGNCETSLNVKDDEWFDNWGIEYEMRNETSSPNGGVQSSSNALQGDVLSSISTSSPKNNGEGDRNGDNDNRSVEAHSGSETIGDDTSVSQAEDSGNAEFAGNEDSVARMRVPENTTKSEIVDVVSENKDEMAKGEDESYPSDTQHNVGNENSEENNMEEKDNKGNLENDKQNSNADNAGSENQPTVEDPFKNLKTKEKRKEREAADASKMNPKQQKVGKIIGVCIVASLIVLIAAFLINPTILRNISDIDDVPPVVPTDTTSFQSEKNLTEQYVQSDEQNSGESNGDSVLAVHAEESNDGSEFTDGNGTPDPHFDAEFVEYMKEKHPSVRLNTRSESKEVTIAKGSRLTLISLENYGNKIYWIYLYLYNKDRIDNPNNVREGTVIRVPAFDPTLVDANNKATLTLASEVSRQFVK